MLQKFIKFIHNKALHNILSVSLLALILYCNYLVFLVVPDERVMGAVQRIFYFHVGSATACYFSFGIVLISALWYLGTRNSMADCLLEASAEVGFVFCTITLVTGMIWGHSAWNTWFSWEPRLVTFLLLWLISLSLVLLRSFGSDQNIGSHCAVVGIVASIMVPVVVFSIKLLPRMAQLHPEVIGNRGLKDPSFISTMFICMGTLVLLQMFFVLIRTRIAYMVRVGAK